ncbi:TetR/AcrR family transcriptional regulator [Mycobacterium sp. AZCC_0083]|uniref:TetR/AcrR family transcriptional regulator n=1 Tax=Mycobacterium sp. AZCC_0083 TaxID=2735882 RepID=UPI001609D54C|nr:TetR/AcrR family transcriptional regulator [Mycobacterium sp. AZCC_0083]MBB5166001.1 AcrR family transcriptional regulator [Mycobacterium sp. AZCC_0083]
MTGLRERKKVDTRRALSDAALKLAFERGLDGVTREDIAELAGVSLRTFNNYFGNKYEALAYRQVQRMERSLAVFRERPVDEQLWSAIAEAVLEPLTAEGVAEVAPTRKQLAVIRTVVLVPETRLAMFKTLFADWVEAIAERTGTDQERDMYPRMVAGVMGAIAEAAMDAYAMADPPVPITTLIRQGFAAVAAGLPVPTTRTGRKNHD